MNTQINWNEPQYLDLPDLRMAVFQAGTRVPGRPSLVLYHGFPELAYSWRHIVGPLVEAGFHVVVPEQRGYGFTGKALNDPGDASGVELYDMAHLCSDVVHLLDALDIEQAVHVGHDFGGLITWQLTFYHAERVAGLVGVNTPFMQRLPMDPIEAFRAVKGDDFYICAFQHYGVAEAQLDADIGHSLRAFYRKGGFVDGQQIDAPVEREWENLEMLKILQREESTWPGTALLNAEDFAMYEAGFTRSGFRGCINWYRNFTRNWENSEGFADKITVPSLMICAEDDQALPPSMAQGMDKYISDLETYLIPDCGHWTQSEKPEELSNLLVDWLKRRFG
ncbi:alpha/beta hydrolase [Alphaproteobacteria bacterium]|nr:alpha/beta hydrolase [Alphaproteobacteria bacterium]